jgi:hypothetical protein
MRTLLIFLLFLFMLPSFSEAGIFDFLSSENKEEKAKQDEACAGQLRIFRKFLYDGRICKSDDDCTVMEGICPMGCRLYINKNFVEIMDTEKEKLSEACPDSVCYYKCPPATSLRPICIRNKCQARSK